jgi:manganese/zinc/iron transport system permease protein
MSQAQLEIQLIASIVAVACALPGVFLVLRRMAMLSDAISHTVLLGIVLAFFLTGDLASPLLVAGAAAVGVVTVVLVEVLHRTQRVHEDAAIGLVFPALFSVAVLLISTYAGDVHLDTDAVLLGELAFAPFRRLNVLGVDLGPRHAYFAGGILLMNVVLLLIFYKELKLATFDPVLAATLGFAPGAIHYGLMTVVSITAVGAFDAVGSILVVAMMIGPPAAAYLLTDRLSHMILGSAGLGMISAIGGYWLAHVLDASIAGSIASVIGLVFLLVFLLAPQRGMLAITKRRSRQRWMFALQMLTIHLLNHEGSPQAEQELHVDHLQDHLRWEAEFAAQVVRRALRQGLVDHSDGRLSLTGSGRQVAAQALAK